MHDHVLKKVSKLTEDDKEDNEGKARSASTHVSYQSTRQRIRLGEEIKGVGSRRMSLNRTIAEQVTDEDGDESGPEPSVHHFDSKKDLEPILDVRPSSDSHPSQPGAVKCATSERSALLQVLLWRVIIHKSLVNIPLLLAQTRRMQHHQ